MVRKLGIGLLLAALGAGCRGGGAVPIQDPALPSGTVAESPQRESALASPRRQLFPPTPGNVHLNLVFNYAVHDLKREIGVVDIVWGASSPNPPQVFNEFYTPFEREGLYAPSNHSLQWWKTHHADWIEYRCDRTSIAWEFGDRHDVPLDIANPAFLRFQRSGAVAPALDAGYDG
ncbi:MAG: hypothetical protein JOY69_07900, partial [Candidatus Eremiobacteraeota bacterium]|nr:hypothetical protein [Candidatus Eremiobacteraeota bacterium]